MVECICRSGTTNAQLVIFPTDKLLERSSILPQDVCECLYCKTLFQPLLTGVWVTLQSLWCVWMWAGPDHRVCCLPTYWLFCGTLTLIRVMSTVLLWHLVHYPKWGVGKIPFIVIINRESRLVYSYLSCGRSHPYIIASIGGRCLSSLKLTLSISIFRWTLQPCMGCTN